MARHAADIIVDKDDQLERVEDFCLPQETIRAVFDLKGGDADFIAVLDRRVIFYGKAFTHTKKAMVTIPYRQIHARKRAPLEAGAFCEQQTHPSRERRFV